MTPERWQRIGALFDRALSEPGPARQAFVRASSEPPDIQDEVVALLSSHDGHQGFLEPPSHLDPGAQVGAYRIVRILGRGGPDAEDAEAGSGTPKRGRTKKSE